ncbi:complement factor H-related protein 3-like isoform X2 [Rhineura floridana]|uniref:complement factor H-related protein 3-like isoform X2 n=1 Tax=Rhineura floridana TaxID=261503 RepID=UPI002AC87FE5|nr:complement factor H-related protein 3-like isoform X2 [Rhineura floridana]
MKNWLICIVSFLLWTCDRFQNVCKSPEIDFGETVQNKKAEYLVEDRLLYRCSPGYDLEGSSWITCKEDGWMPPPKCLAPCSITKQQLDEKNLLLHSGQRHSEFIKNSNILEFTCKKGYIIISPSVRKCVDGNMDLPTCNPAVPDKETFPTNATTSKRLLPLAWNLSTPVICTAPEVGSGNFFPVKSQYKFEDVIYAECYPGYQLESYDNSFKCTKYGWLPYPKCIPKRCGFPHVENGALSWSDTYYSDVYFPKKEGQTITFRCNRGFLPENKKYWYKIRCTNLGWDPEPKCFRQCFPPKRLLHGEVIQDSKDAFIEGDKIAFHCDAGYYPKYHRTSTCTKNDWLPTLNCPSAPAS